MFIAIVSLYDLRSQCPGNYQKSVDQISVSEADVWVRTLIWTV